MWEGQKREHPPERQFQEAIYTTPPYRPLVIIQSYSYPSKSKGTPGNTFLSGWPRASWDFIADGEGETDIGAPSSLPPGSVSLVCEYHREWERSQTSERKLVTRGLAVTFVEALSYLPLKTLIILSELMLFHLELFTYDGTP